MQIEESAGTPNKFIVMRREVLEDTKLSAIEKMVCARIATFDEYFESSEACAKLLGFSKRQVENAKRALEKAGYIKCVANTGRGKRYKAVYDIPKSVSQTYRNQHIRPTEIGKSDLPKSVDIDKRLEENIEESNTTKDTNVSLGESELSPVEYGNPEINEMFLFWEEVFGFEQKQSKRNRNACSNLLKKKGVGKDNLKKIVRLRAEADKDQFAPRDVRGIVDFASLQSNLPHLMMWARRKYSEHQEQQEGIEI